MPLEIALMSTPEGWDACIFELDESDWKQNTLAKIFRESKSISVLPGMRHHDDFLALHSAYLAYNMLTENGAKVKFDPKLRLK